MRIVIAGGHGQIALRLERLLAARGDEVAGIIRRAEQGDDLRAAGAEPVLCDLESASVEQVAAHLQGADAAVFAAGAGPGSGPARKATVDRGAAVLFADAAERARVRRHVVVSSMGADPAHPGDDVFDLYLRAKGEADEYVRGRTSLEWTILRPGSLIDDSRHRPRTSGGLDGPRSGPAGRRRRGPGGAGGDSRDGRTDPGVDQRLDADFGGGQIGRGELDTDRTRPFSRPAQNNGSCPGKSGTEYPSSVGWAAPSCASRRDPGHETSSPLPGHQADHAGRTVPRRRRSPDGTRGSSYDAMT